MELGDLLMDLGGCGEGILWYSGCLQWYVLPSHSFHVATSPKPGNSLETSGPHYANLQLFHVKPPLSAGSAGCAAGGAVGWAGTGGLE